MTLLPIPEVNDTTPGTKDPILKIFRNRLLGFYDCYRILLHYRNRYGMNYVLWHDKINPDDVMPLQDAGEFRDVICSGKRFVPIRSDITMSRGSWAFHGEISRFIQEIRARPGGFPEPAGCVIDAEAARMPSSVREGNGGDDNNSSQNVLDCYHSAPADCVDPIKSIMTDRHIREYDPLNQATLCDEFKDIREWCKENDNHE